MGKDGNLKKVFESIQFIFYALFFFGLSALFILDYRDSLDTILGVLFFLSGLFMLIYPYIDSFKGLYSPIGKIKTPIYLKNELLSSGDFSSWDYDYIEKLKIHITKANFNKWLPRNSLCSSIEAAETILYVLWDSQIEHGYKSSYQEYAGTGYRSSYEMLFVPKANNKISYSSGKLLGSEPPSTVYKYANQSVGVMFGSPPETPFKFDISSDNIIEIKGLKRIKLFFKNCIICENKTPHNKRQKCILCGKKTFENGKTELIDLADRIVRPNMVPEDNILVNLRKIKANTIEEILGNLIECTSYNDLEAIINKSNKPVLVMIYPNEKITSPESEIIAVIYKNLSMKYDYRVKFLACKFHKSLRTKNYNFLPLIAMYSKFDLLKGETPENNDGEMKQIDLLKGSPSEINLNRWYYNLSQHWIPTNLIYSDAKYLWRMSKTKINKWRKIMR